MAASVKHIELAQAYIQRVRTDPVWFFRDVLNHKRLEGEASFAEAPGKSWELDQFTIDIAEACADVWRKKVGLPTVINHDGRNYIVVRAGHGPGKTHTGALLCHWFNTGWPGRVICTAPKLAQLRSRVWGALRKIDARAEPWYRSTHVIHDTSVNWLRPNDKGRLVEDKNWTILAETATHPENIAGHHERFQMMLVEEATGVTENLWPTLFGALSSGEFQLLVAIANPTKITGTFANAFLQKREEQNYFRYHINLKNARRIDREWVAKMERKYGKDSPVVAVRCHGEFPTADPNQLIALEWVQAAMDREFVADGSMPHKRITVDVADGGEDESVVTIAEHYQSRVRVRKQTVHSFPAAESPIRCADAAEALWKEYGCSEANGDYFIVDGLGVGAGTAGTLLARGYPVVRYVGGGASADNTRWRNRRAQSYHGLRDAMRDGYLSFDDGFCDIDEQDDVVAQLCSIKTKPEQDRVDDLVTKENMKADGIKSPDRADSLAMQFSTQVPQYQTGQFGGEEVFVVESSAWSGF